MKWQTPRPVLGAGLINSAAWQRATGGGGPGAAESPGHPACSSGAEIGIPDGSLSPPSKVHAGSPGRQAGLGRGRRAAEGPARRTAPEPGGRRKSLRTKHLNPSSLAKPGWQGVSAELEGARRTSPRTYTERLQGLGRVTWRAPCAEDRHSRRGRLRASPCGGAQEQQLRVAADLVACHGLP